MFFLGKDFKRTKTQIKPKSTNKTKISEHWTTKTTIFRAQKLLRRWKSFVLRFDTFCTLKIFQWKKINRLEIISITSFTILLKVHLWTADFFATVLTTWLYNVFYYSLSKTNTLRSYLFAEVIKTATISGDGREDSCKSKWPNFKLLMFLKDNLTPKRTISSLVRLFMI